MELPNNEKNLEKDVDAIGLFKKNIFNVIANFPSGYFTLVMATGIVSIAAHLFAYGIITDVTLYINIIAFILLSLILIIRLLFYTTEIVGDFYNSDKNLEFLSFPAACCVLGSQFVLIFNNNPVGIFFFILGFTAWIFFIYTLFAVRIEEDHKPSFVGINGSWLLIIVSTQSLAVLSGLLAENFPQYLDKILFFSFVLFLCGGMFYIIIITMIFYRLIFLKVQAERLQANYWISMGADAISVLAGTILILNAGKSTFLFDVLPFIKGFTSFFWAIGTWWIPLIVVLGVWRHVIKKVKLKYTYQYWSLVFPLGMYSVCTIKLSEVMGLPFLNGIASIFAMLSIVAWAIVSIGVINSILKYIRTKS